MSRKLAQWIIALGVLTPGCGPFGNATRTLVIEPIQYCATADSILEKRHERKLADAAWKATLREHPETGWSPDYACGFKDGFADYLYAGGTGEPPPLPPRWYWKSRYETPEGHQAIQDWFAGFRHGAAEAQRSGHRQGTIVPSSLQHLNAAPLTSEPVSSPPSPEVLPPPNANDKPDSSVAPKSEVSRSVQPPNASPQASQPAANAIPLPTPEELSRIPVVVLPAPDVLAQQDGPVTVVANLLQPAPLDDNHCEILPLPTAVDEQDRPVAPSADLLQPLPLERHPADRGQKDP